MTIDPISLSAQGIPTFNFANCPPITDILSEGNDNLSPELLHNTVFPDQIPDEITSESDRSYLVDRRSVEK